MNLNQVTLPSRDIEGSIKFYERLGLKLIVHTSPRYARFEVPAGGATLSVHLVDEPPKGPGVVVYFECEDLDTRVVELKSAGVVFENDPTDQSWLWREAHLRDPDGNLLCLYRAGEARRFPPWRLAHEPEPH